MDIVLYIDISAQASLAAGFDPIDCFRCALKLCSLVDTYNSAIL